MLVSALRICEAEFGMLMLHHSGDGSFDTRVMVGAPRDLVDALLHRSFTPPPGNPLDRMLQTKKRCMSSTQRRKRPNRSLHNWLARGHISACLCLRRTKSLAPSPSTARRFDHSERTSSEPVGTSASRTCRQCRRGRPLRCQRSKPIRRSQRE